MSDPQHQQQPPPPLPDPPANGSSSAPPPETLAPAGIASKRQRRPSVRLGDIGEQPAADSHLRRTKQLRVSSTHREPFPGGGKFSSKTRALTNLVSAAECHDLLDIQAVDRPLQYRHYHHGGGGAEESLGSMFGARRGGRDGKGRRAGPLVSRRVRTNWFSKVDEEAEGGDLKLCGEEDVGDEGNYREYDDMRREGSESPPREQSRSDRRASRVRISESRDIEPLPTDAAEFDAPSETGGRDWNNGRGRLLDNGGVRSWLDGLGLGRYTPVFEIHEVDDEALPLLTLEDLKDMGINAVGSRRKMYSAIQKLAKEFT